jgi:O-methyltransferase
MLTKIINAVKYKLEIGTHGPNGYKFSHKDMDEAFMPIHESVRPFTMTTIERTFSVFKAVEYIVKHNIPGDFVECGVWRGGSSMVIAKTLLHFGVKNRKIYLYDTYEGMSAPTEKDRDLDDDPAEAQLNRAVKTNKAGGVWCYADLEDVQANIFSTGYPKDHVFFVKGKVEDTIPNTLPSQIALLRLDTDWYESTYHELVHLYPLLAKAGVLIVDDYGHWRGSREAVDQYFDETKQAILLNRIDYTGRMGVKIS